LDVLHAGLPADGVSHDVVQARDDRGIIHGDDAGARRGYGALDALL
jgi:hypothetical protein